MGTTHSGIQYLKELRNYVSTLKPGTVFGFQEFRDARFPGVPVNKHSMRSPFLKLEQEGFLVLVERGIGKRKVSYRKARLAVACNWKETVKDTGLTLSGGQYWATYWTDGTEWQKPLDTASPSVAIVRRNAFYRELQEAGATVRRV